MNGFKSELLKNSYGVPKGSILGSLVFVKYVIYINNLNKAQAFIQALLSIVLFP